ncbi:hypothetical protein [Sphingomonas phage Kimi]|nr:hypothetical protein [Sphingomonas phage Kimi]
MIIPTEDQLNEIAGLIAPGMTFPQLGPEARLQVLNLAILAEISHSLDSIAGDTAKVGDWFKHSKLWDGM